MSTQKIPKLQLTETETVGVDNVLSNLHNTLFNNSNATDIDTETNPYNMSGGYFWNRTSKNDVKALEAARSNQQDVINFFINNDLIDNYTCKDNEGCTILHYLSRNNANPQVVNNILSRNDVSSFINLKDNQGNTPVVTAVKYDNHEFAQKLVNFGADLNIKNNEGFHVEATDSATYQEGGNRTTHNGLRNMLNKFKKLNNTLSATETSGMPDTLSAIQQNEFHGGNRNSGSNEIKLNITTTENFVKPEPLYHSGGTETHRSVVQDTYTIQNTEQFIDQLVNNYVNKVNHTGGANRVLLGQRRLNTYSNYANAKPQKKRMFNEQVDEIHQRVMKKLMKLLKTKDEDKVKAYKSLIYNKVKTDKPELKNMDRALEMEKLTTSKMVEELTKKRKKDIDAIVKSIKKRREEHAKKHSTESSHSSVTSSYMPSESGLNFSQTSAFSPDMTRQVSVTSSVMPSETALSATSYSVLSDNLSVTSPM